MSKRQREKIQSTGGTTQHDTHRLTDREQRYTEKYRETETNGDIEKNTDRALPPHISYVMTKFVNFL